MRIKNIKKFFIIFLILCLLLPEMESAVLASNNDQTKDDNKDKITSLNLTNDLEKKIAKSGKAKVIVELDEQFSPEGLISKNKIGIQKNKITEAQETVLEHLKDKANSKKISLFKTIPFMALEVDSEGLKELRENKLVKSITEDLKVTKSDINTKNEEETAISPQLYSTNNLMDTEKAWSAGYTGQGKTIAILDTGVDKYHPFLQNKVVSEGCYSSLGLCPGNSTASTGPGSAVDTEGHGTHVAGIATGRGTQFSGVAKNANIIAIKVLANDGNGNFSDLINGLERVYSLRGQYDISAINLSLGGGSFSGTCDYTYSSMKSIIDNLKSVGIATIVASGNEYTKSALSAPACISSAVSVGATNNSDAVASFSNSSSYLDLLAPGNPVYSSVPGGGYSSYSGTSMATPQVTGGFTLVQQKYPNASVDQIVSYLRQNGVNVRDTANGITTPRLDFTWMEARLPSLVQVQRPTWNGDVIQWSGVSNASQYEIKLYRGTTVVNTQRAGTGARQYNYASLMATPGVYTVTIQAIGDYTHYADGAASLPSNGNRKGVAYFEDFESNNGNFTAAGTYSTWQWGTPTSGPSAAYSGTKVWSTNLSGHYNNNENSYIISPTINLSNLSSPITLSWMQYAVTELNYDYLNVEISKDSGLSWESIYRNSGYINQNWGNHEINIDPSYAVPNFRVRFKIQTDGSSTSSGIYIDDVMVKGAAALPSLPQVHRPTWNGDVIQWVGVANANQYELKLYKGTELVSTQHVGASVRQNNFSSLMTSPGGYTVTVQAMGDHTSYRDGLTSSSSAENRKVITLAQVQKPTWDGDIVQWSSVANADQYEVKLYRGSTVVSTQRVEASVRQYNFTSQLTSTGVYTVTVQAIGDHTNYFDGARSLPSDGIRKDIVLFEDFDSNNGNFTVEGTNSTWQWGTPTSGPSSAYSGANVWATNLTGDYNNFESSSIVSPNINLSNIDSSITLGWMQYAVTETGYDYLSVEISNDGGQTWDSKYWNSGRIDQSWGCHEINIDSSYAVPNFKVRFRIVADGSVTNPGIYIDNLKVSGTQSLHTLSQVQRPTWNGETIQWFGVANANQYELKLFKGTDLVGTQRVSASVRQINFSSQMNSTGAYTATVQAIGDNSNYRDGLTSIRSDENRKVLTLAQVAKPSWNSDVLQWNDVDNATQYEVKLYRGTTLVDTKGVNASVRQINFSFQMNSPGTYTATVQAIGDNNLYRNGSVSILSNQRITVSQVQKPTWNGDVIKWFGVASTTQYEVKLYRGTSLIVIRRVGGSVRQYNFASLMKTPGSYSVTVQAIGDNRLYRNGPVSARSTQKITLNSVQKPTWSGDVIKWSGVASANQYEVKLYRGTSLIITRRVGGSVRQYNFVSLMKTPGSYSVTVQAIGDNRLYRNGSVSARSTQRITLNSVQKPAWNGTAIKWNGVANANQYEVKLYRGTVLVDTRRVRATVKQYNYASLMKKSGSYTVTVQAIGDTRYFKNGPVSPRSNIKRK
ncbi:S8 family serine peptidase [Neobacillus drentensis]|uniref:S8 family serine peptidase n=1 Tax=Neobacillus drentensis TaxID=220684 RepID=UPI002862F82A|nr:S8 family serine peptidase [Neobacillus drentensis]MDR7240438.1 subtilisin family serine protease [Neobacillus drentensis]